MADQSSMLGGLRPLPAIGVAALAGAIFLLASWAPVELSVSFLYVLGVMVAALVYPRPGVLVFALLCAALTVLSHVTSPGDAWNPWALFDRALGLVGLAISTVLVLRN